MTLPQSPDPNDPAIPPAEDPTNTEETPTTSSQPTDAGASTGPDNAKPPTAPT
jgi:hypothetical protein